MLCAWTISMMIVTYALVTPPAPSLSYGVPHSLIKVEDNVIHEVEQNNQVVESLGTPITRSPGNKMKNEH